MSAISDLVKTIERNQAPFRSLLKQVERLDRIRLPLKQAERLRLPVHPLLKQAEEFAKIAVPDRPLLKRVEESAKIAESPLLKQAMEQFQVRPLQRREDVKKRRIATLEKHNRQLELEVESLLSEKQASKLLHKQANYSPPDNRAWILD